MAQYGLPEQDITVDFWYNTPLWSKVDDGAEPDYSDYITHDDSSERECELLISDMIDPGVDYGHYVHVWARNVGTSHKITVRLFQGASEKATTGWVYLNTGQWTHIQLSFDGAGITDYTDLRVRLKGGASVLNALNVAMVAVEAPNKTINISETGTASDSVTVAGINTSVNIADYAGGYETLSFTKPIDIIDNAYGQEFFGINPPPANNYMVRNRGLAADETFEIHLYNSTETTHLKFCEKYRNGFCGTVVTPPWITDDLNAEDYELTWKDNGVSQLRLKITDPQRVLYDNMKQGSLMRAILNNPAHSLSLSTDMETLISASALFDWSGNGHTIGLANMTGPCDIAGWHGRGFQFNGSTNYIQVTHASDLTSGVAMTFTFAVQFDSVVDGDKSRTLITKADGVQNGYWIEHYGGNKLRFGYFTGLGTTATWDTDWIPQIGKWYVIGLVWDLTSSGKEAVFYVDGVPLKTTLSSGVAQAITQSTGSLNIGGAGFRSQMQNFDGAMDELAIYMYSFSAEEMRLYYKRFAVTPRIYFQGVVSEIEHQNGITAYTAIDDVSSLLDNEIYDVIFEGMNSGDIGFLYKKIRWNLSFPEVMELHLNSDEYVPFSIWNAYHNPVSLTFYKTNSYHTGGPHVPLFKNDMGLLNYSHLSPEDKVVVPLILEYPSNSAFRSHPNADSEYLIGGENVLTNWEGFAMRFTATSDTVKDVCIEVLPNTVDVFKLKLEILDSEMNPIASSGDMNIYISNTKRQWLHFDFSTASAGKLSRGSDYWLAFKNLSLYYITHTITWLCTKGEIQTKRWEYYGTGEWEDVDPPRTPYHVIHMEGSYEQVPEEDYEIKVAEPSSGAPKYLVAEFGQENADFAPSGKTYADFVPYFFRGTYFYSVKGTYQQTALDVINRLLNTVGYSAVYNALNGMSSTLGNYRLPFYAPQGGTIREHVEQIASLVGEKLFVLPGKKVLFLGLPDPSHIPNFSFEYTSASDVTKPRDWTTTTTGGTQGASVALTTSDALSGDRCLKIMTASGANESTAKVYQDFAEFDPRPSDASGGNIEFWVLTEQMLPSNSYYRLVVYDYNSFDNPMVIFSGRGSNMLNWTRHGGKISRTAFRLSFEVYKSSLDSGQYNVYLDDIRFHAELDNIFVIDPAISDSDYNSGRFPGSFKLRDIRASGNELDSQGVISLITDIENTPEINEQISGKIINTSMVFGSPKKITYGYSSGPIVGIARNPAASGIYGERVKASRLDAVKTDEDAYTRAKSFLSRRWSIRSKLSLVGQYPWLIGRMINLFFMNQGLKEPVPMLPSEIIIGNNYTELNVNRSFVEEFEDTEKLRARTEKIEGSFFPDFAESSSYITYIDIPASVVTSAIDKIAFGTVSGAITNKKKVKVMDTRDGNLTPWVWMVKVGKADGPSFNSYPFGSHNTRGYTHIYIYNSSDTLLGSVALKNPFCKLPNMWIVIYMFAR